MENESLSFSVIVDIKISNAGQPRYRWYKKEKADTEAIFVNDTADLTFESLNRDNVSIYFCVVLLGDSVVRTEDIDLKVNCKLFFLLFQTIPFNPEL